VAAHPCRHPDIEWPSAAARGIFFKADKSGKKGVAGVDKARASAYETYGS
jgi:hypothetical protein